MATELDNELDRLERRLPKKAARLVHRVRGVRAAYRIGLGLALTAGGLLGFLPLLGFWMAPLGLALMAQDVPPMRRPMARMVGAVNRRLEPRD